MFGGLTFPCSGCAGFHVRGGLVRWFPCSGCAGFHVRGQAVSGADAHHWPTLGRGRRSPLCHAGQGQGQTLTTGLRWAGADAHHCATLGRGRRSPLCHAGQGQTLTTVPRWAGADAHHWPTLGRGRRSPLAYAGQGQTLTTGAKENGGAGSILRPPFYCELGNTNNSKILLLILVLIAYRAIVQPFPKRPRIDP